MRILFLNHNLIWRGTFFRCLGFARELVKLGHEVHIWTAARSTDLFGSRMVIDGVHVWQTPRWGRLGKHDGGYAPLDNFCRLIFACRGRWDVVHAFDHRPNVLLPWLWLEIRLRTILRRTHTLFVSDWCDWWTAGGITTSRRTFAWIDRFEQKIEEGSKRISDGVTVISTALYGRALEIGIDQENLLLLASGVTLDKFPRQNKYECRKTLSLPIEEPLLGFIGFSLWDMQLLADAFTQIKQEVPSAKLLVVGGGVEAEAQDIFRERFHISQDVILPGVVSFDEVPTYLGACDIQLLPLNDTLANRARLPNKLLDYYASGRPIVCSNVGEAGKFIQEHNSGLLAGTDANSFAQAAVSLIVDKPLAQEYGENARRMAETEFSFASLTPALLQFYRQHFSS